jgi:DNA-binding NarL/FixJ family response regulator
VDIAADNNIAVAIVVRRSVPSLSETLSKLKMIRANLPVIVAGRELNQQIVLDVLRCGARGYVFEGAPPEEFAKAIQVVNQGSIWAPRKALSKMVDLVLSKTERNFKTGPEITAREQQILTMLVTGLTNKQIGKPLGIVERTVNAHISKMMHKLGVQNRIALLVHALSHSLVIYRQMNDDGPLVMLCSIETGSFLAKSPE